MRRWDLEYKPGNYVGAGDSVLVPRNGGDWVDYDDHLAELRQTQRRMIAALYWRAGEARCEGERALRYMVSDALAFAETHTAYIMRNRAEWLSLAQTARAMEAACPR